MKLRHLLLAFLSILLLVSGLEADEIITTDGKKYQGVKILKVDPDGLKVMHNAGITKIPFKILSKKLQDKHGYDPEKAQKYIEKKKAKKLERGRKIQLKKEKEAKLRVARKKEREEQRAKKEQEFKEISQKIYSEGEAYVTIKKTCFHKKKGGMFFLEENKIVPFYEDYYLVGKDLCIKSVPALVKADEHITKIKANIEKMEEQIVNNKKNKKANSKIILSNLKEIENIKAYRNSGSRNKGSWKIAKLKNENRSLEKAAKNSEKTNINLKSRITTKQTLIKSLVKQMEEFKMKSEEED